MKKKSDLFFMSLQQKNDKIEFNINCQENLPYTCYGKEFALNDLMKFTHEGCYHGLNCSARGLFLDCLVSGEEKEINESRCKLEEIEDNLYHLVYKNADQDLEDASQRLQSKFNLSNYFNSKYDRLRRMLERLAINKHRDMVVDGRIKSEYVLPIEKVKGFDKHDDNDEKTF